MEQSSTWLLLGSVFAALGVLLGAFGAHVLEGSSLLAGRPDDLATFEIGVRYQMYHSLALLLLYAISQSNNHPWLNYAGYAFVAGILIFSGSLYLLVLTNTRWLGAITPIGGIAFVAGWILLALSGRTG